MTIETEFTNALVTIASGLGLAAEQIFGTFVGAQPMLGVLNIASLVIAFCVSYIAGKLVYKAMLPIFTDKNGEWDSYESPFVVFGTSLGVVAISLLLIYAIVGDAVAPSIMQIMYPEYTAAKEIIELVTP